ALVTLPARAEIAADRFEAAQLEAAEATLRVAAEARRSYYRAVAAREEARVLEQAAAAAEVAAKLARELGETGAINRLDQARDQLFHAEMAAKLTAARQNEITERERLARALGLWGDDLQFKLPSELPRLPQRPLSLPNVERDAVEQRVDLEAGRKELSALTKAMGLASSTRLLNLFQLSALGKITRENVGSDRVQFNEVGPGATIEAPIFDLGETRVRESEERWLEAVNLLAEKAVNVRSQAREAYSNYRAAHEIALRHQREITPLHATISEETLKRYNTMLVDVFALLEEARRRVLAAAERVEARRNFWLAEVNLRGAIVGGGVFPAEESDAKASAADKASDYP
ncbi:MAG TPA: TolC family protein, partial [Methylocystis sp.]|nr:TolC family protein [Methylocystis sp.]